MYVAQPVRRDLHAVREARCNVGDERVRASRRRACPTRKDGTSLVSASIATNVHVSPTRERVVLRRDVALLLADEGPQLVDLEARRTSRSRIVSSSRSAQPSPTRTSSVPIVSRLTPVMRSVGADRAALDEGADDRDLLFSGEVVGHGLIV